MSKQRPIKLKVVGHDDSIDKKGFDGSMKLRLFSKDPGEYTIERWHEVGQWVLRKNYKSHYTWIPLRADQVLHIKEGGTILIDNDIVEASVKEMTTARLDSRKNKLAQNFKDGVFDK